MSVLLSLIIVVAGGLIFCATLAWLIDFIERKVGKHDKDKE